VVIEQSSLRSVHSQSECLAIEPRKSFIVGVSAVVLSGTTLLAAQWSGAAIRPGSLEQGERTIEALQELGRSYDFHNYFPWSRATLRLSLCTRRRCERQIVQNYGIAKRRTTKCGEM